MRKVIVNEFMTLDGVVQAPGGVDEDRDGGFEHGGWQMPYADDIFGKAIMEGMAQAGGYLLVTLTAYYGLAEAVRLRPGESVLVTAGAGGLGTTAIQMARALGAGQVTAVASTPEKQRYALEHGADRAIGYEAEFPRSEVVFDTVGGEVFLKCLEAVPPLGRMALIGASSGTPPEVPGFDALRRRNVGVFCFSFGMLRRADPALVAATAPRAIELLLSGKVRPPVGESLPLEQAADAHRRLTSRQTVGKVVLIP